MAISQKVEGFLEKASWIRRMFEEGETLKKKFGADNILDFTLGNPELEPPAEVVREIIRLANSSTPGLHRYMPNAGFPGVRETIANFLSKENKIEFRQNHIIMTVGAGGGINVVLKSLLDPGEEVILFSPYFVEYRFYVDNHGGIYKEVDTKADFSLDVESAEKAIGPKTKALIINSPNNPTGAVYSEDQLKDLGQLLAKKEKVFNRDIYLLSDEPYKKLVYDGIRCPSVFEFYHNSIVVTSHSKDLALPGERIGYIAVSPEARPCEKLIEAMVFANRTLGFVNAPAFMQLLVQNFQELSVDISQYQEKRDLLYDNLTAMGYSTVKPQGAFYIFPKSPIEDDVAFVRKAQQKNVLVVPGSGFGRRGYFRIAYCVAKEVIVKALPQFDSLAQEFNLR